MSAALADAVGLNIRGGQDFSKDLQALRGGMADPELLFDRLREMFTGPQSDTYARGYVRQVQKALERLE